MIEKQEIGLGSFYLGDCLEVMAGLPDASVDMLLVDLPYGRTDNPWDCAIPLDQLWEQYNRICKRNAAMVMTSIQPFTTELIHSNIKNFKYPWYWRKTRPTGILNAKKQPLRVIEDICVFYRAQCTYNPQGVVRLAKPVKHTRKTGGGCYQTTPVEHTREFTGYPVQVLDFPRDSGSFHPTQKPVGMFEYLVRTYTNPGDLVLDNCAGSGTTAVAAENSGRRWICIEQDAGYFKAATDRVLQVADLGLDMPGDAAA